MLKNRYAKKPGMLKTRYAKNQVYNPYITCMKVRDHNVRPLAKSTLRPQRAVDPKTRV